eukprot:scaffold8976_cov60-Attheya_sp.AAC.1
MDNALLPNLPSLGRESCLSSCFESCQIVISLFEEDRLCADGFFCAEQSPYCQDCKTVMETTTPLHCSQSKVYNDNAFCNERPCFQPCSDNDPCSEDGFFCTYELGATGFCQHCESWGNIQTPLDCTNNDRLTQLLNPAGQESCVTSCFQHCDEQTPCQTNGSFCTFHDKDKGSTRGVCQDCNMGHIQTPLDCKMLSADGREGCVDACVQPCSPSIDNSPCRPGSFCTNLDMDVDTSGACMSCDGLTPLDCSDPEKTAYGEERCALECFAMSPCSEASPCPEGFFCTYQSDNSTTSDESLRLSSSANGYCLGCDRFIDPIACFFGDFPATFKESCASTCFNECSAEFPCEDGSFCNYEFETSGFCSSCEWFTNHMECGKDSDMSFFGISSCKNTCFGCDMNNPCPDGRYCNFVDMDFFGFCDACPTFDPKKCADDDNSFAVDSCTSNCFDACSETSSCPVDGYFCDFQSGDTGVCMNCNGSRINTPLECKNLSLNPSGEESCATTCFDVCDEENPCKNDGEFCTFQIDTSGSCMDCNTSSIQDPLDCNELNLNPLGETSCATQCFDSCDMDIDCLEDNYFCTFQLGSSGSCMDCNHWRLNGNPFQCSDSTFLPEASKGSCLSNCFDDCSLDNPCGDDNNFFCTSSAEGGYCMDCNAVNGNPNGCLNLDLSFVDEEQCLSTCLVKCVIDEDCPVPDIGFVGEGCDGFCSAQCINGAPVFGGYCTSQCQAWCGGVDDVQCKFCPNLTPDIVEDIIGHNNTNQTDTPAIPPIQKSNMCNFCPNNDMKYPDRHMRMWVGAFGPEAKCSDLGSYFSTVPTNPNSRNCRLAQMMDHTCGCTGNGYGGADSTTKMAVLAWFPRCMAFLSFMGSTIILFNIITLENKQRKTFNQFMILLSLFDMIGSVAYAFTTLPLPAEDYMYGSRGNAATCTAQGFFIQLGVIAAYMNVSLSFYYLLILKFGWSESRIEKLRPWLFGVPIAIGLTFAFAGIPYYDNMILWCNNTSNIWPDIPMAVAIIVATVNMGLISCHVYKEEKVSRKWRSGTQQKSLSSKVFRQSILYLLAFYLVWPPYLVLQYLWAAGSAFDKFGFILFAGVAVPLQGFWNCLAYMIPRMKKRKGVDFLGLRSAISRLSTKISKSVGRKTSRESYKEDSGTTHKGIPPKATELSSVGLKSSRESHLFEVSFDVEDNIFPLSENCPSPVNVKGADGAEQIIENGTKEELEKE